MSKTPFLLRFAVIVFLFSSSSADQRLHSRHLLHQPFYPIITASPPPSSSEPPSSSPNKHHHHKKHPEAPPPQDKHLFSSVTSPPPPPAPHSNPFFPSNAVHPSPPPPPPASIPTFPANISSLFFPPHNSSKPHNNRHIAKLVSITVSVVSSSVLLSLLVVLFIFLRRNRRLRLPAYNTKSTRSDSHQLFNASPSDGTRKHKQNTSSNTCSDFLFLGTFVNSRSEGLPQQKSPVSVSGNVAGVLELPPAPASSSSSSSYSHNHKPGSPELRPLPPLPKLPAFTPTYLSPEQLFPKRHVFDGDGDDDEFFSPRGSSGRKQSPPRAVVSSGVVQSGDRSVNGSNSCSPTTTSFNDSPATSSKPKSPSPPLSLQSQNSSNDDVLKQPGPVRPPPPPPPPPQFNDAPATKPLSPPSDPDKKEETLKPKLKPLHWDKVRASSSRVMVWDQIKSNSFQ